MRKSTFTAWLSLCMLIIPMTASMAAATEKYNPDDQSHNVGQSVDSAAKDSSIMPQKSLSAKDVKSKKRHKISKVRKVVRGFSSIDTAYIEPQAYIYTVMLQNTNTFEIYHISNGKGQEVVFAPKPSYKVGPYIGWRWVFLGYTIDLTHLSGEARQDLNLSVYSNQIGFDLFWRKSGDDYRISQVNFGKKYNTSGMHNVAFDGFHSSVRGFNVYYIFNHRRFSYPAAYSQSTIQRRSQGSPLAGIGYTRHSLDIDWEKFHEVVNERLGKGYLDDVTDTALMRSNVEYTDFSVSGGYAYNWVFAHNWLLDVSLQLAIAYKHTKGDANTEHKGMFQEFDFRNFNLDGISRIGIVWNNMRWYAGANAIFHAYNYKKKQFQTNNIFGNVNFYVGYNFGSIHKKKKNKTKK